MNSIFTNVALDIIMLILGAFISHIVGRRFFNDNAKPNIINNGVVNYEESKIIIKQIITINDNSNNYNNNSNNSGNTSNSDDDTWGLIFIAGFVMLALVWASLKFKAEIFLVIRLLSIFTLSLTLTSIYKIKKHNVKLDRNFMLILTMSIISLLSVQLSLYLTDKPIYYATIDKNSILNQMESSGALTLITNFDSNVLNFLMSQLVGLFCSTSLLVLQVFQIFNILSILNIAFSEKVNFFWKFVFNKTSKLAGPITHSIISIIFIALSILLSSGFFVHILSNNNFSSLL